jgi:ketosteroid isomerase-like protein
VSIEENTRIVQNIHPLWNNREFDRILSEMIAEDIEWTTVPTGETSRGYEGFRQFIGRGTHEGPLVSPAGEIPPTGRSVKFTLCEVYKFRDGKIAEGHTHFESLGLMTQLGVVPPPEQGGS